MAVPGSWQRVARGAGATTDLPLPYTAFPWIPYQLVVETGGRRIEAATALGIGRNTITRKIQELGLD